MTRAHDTSKEVEAWRDQRLRQMSATEKLERVAALTKLMRDLVIADVRAQNPEASDHHVRRMAARRWLGDDLVRLAYGDA
jgi:hypothetical protein